MIAALALLTAPALAQTTTGTTGSEAVATGGFDAHGYRLWAHDSDVRDPLTFLRPGAQSGADWYAGGQLEYASRPLVFEPRPGERDVVLSNLAGLNLAAGAAALDMLRFDASMPVFVTSTGPDGSNGAAVGDLRLASMVSLLTPSDDGGLGVGLVGAVDLPTGSVDDYLGEGGLSAVLATTGTAEVDAYTASWSLGARFVPNTTPEARPAPTRGGDTLQASVAVGRALSDRTGVTVEGGLDLAFDSAVRTAIGIPAQALASVRHVLPGGTSVSAGLGVGLGNGAGASPIRLVVGGGFGGAVEIGTSDGDADGVVGEADRCPDEPETRNGFEDTDGCPDDLPWGTIRAVVDGEPVEAEMIVERPDGREDPGVGSVKLPVVPGKSYRVTAELGSCLRVDTTVTPSPEGGTIDVPLEVERATVVVTVTDSIGTPIEGATVRYFVEDPRCEATSRELTDGRGTHEVGIGSHQVYVTADGYDVFQMTFELRAGQTRTIDARLNPVR